MYACPWLYEQQHAQHISCLSYVLICHHLRLSLNVLQFFVACITKFAAVLASRW